MRYMLEISYNGGAYHGWQRQPNATSIQEEIEKALAIIFRNEVLIMGSSRTDTGVHASQQYAHFDWPAAIKEPGKCIHGLNKLLPKDIAILDLFEVPTDVHARFNASHRKYIYRIIKHKNTFFDDIAYEFKQDLNFDAMQQACEILKVHRDYESFSKYHTEVNTFECSIYEAQWLEKDQMLEFHIQANRFLRGMVRAIVGTMLDIGTGKTTIEEFKGILAAKDRIYAGKSAPAKGLMLVEVGYPNI